MSEGKVKIAAIGLGNRTCKYLRYVAEHRDVAELVAVVDPDESKFTKVCDTFLLSPDRCFKSIDVLIESGIEVDACIIGTPDTSHFELAVKSVGSGFHILLEKPMGQSAGQCQAIVEAGKKSGKMVTVCYILRYHPYFIKLKEITEDPEVGKMLSIKHTERVGIDRTVHTFVRGPWNLSEMNTTMFFTKCCHDLDFVLWLAGEDVKSVRNVEGNEIFREHNAPEGSASRCLDCQIEKSCPYSAVDLYLRRKDWIKGFYPIPGENQEEMLHRVLVETRYGRCAFRCPENNAVDRQSMILEMESGMKAEVVMDCLTKETNRETVVECTDAVIYGDESVIEVRYKDGREPEIHDFHWTRNLDCHAGADLLVIKEFIEAIRSGHLHTRTSGATSLKSHLICFQAEK